jgi:hypothetical protein
LNATLCICFVEISIVACVVPCFVELREIALVLRGRR